MSRGLTSSWNATRTSPGANAGPWNVEDRSRRQGVEASVSGGVAASPAAADVQETQHGGGLRRLHHDRAAGAAQLRRATGRPGHGQAFGVELQASLMPAAGGMGGTGIARPQDVQSALALNPATLAQKKGTQFSLSSLATVNKLLCWMLDGLFVIT